MFFVVVFTWCWIQFFFKEIVLVIGNCCITMSEIELFSGELSFGAVNLCFRCSYLKIVFHSNLQSILLNKKDDTCPPEFTNLSASIELSLWRRRRCCEHSMVKFVSTRGHLIPHICVWTSVSLRRLYIDQFPPLHFKDWNEVFVSKGSKDISHANKIFLCTMELPNKSASFVVIFVFVLFSFRPNLWPLF